MRQLTPPAAPDATAPDATAPDATAPYAAAPDAAALSSATAELDAAGVPFDLAWSPAVLPVSAYRQMARAWRAVRRGLDAFAERHDGDLRAMAAALGLPESMVPVWGSLPARDWCLIARPDMIWGRDAGTGQRRCVVVDINAGSLAGLFPLNDMLLRAHRAPGLRPFFATRAQPRFLIGQYADILRRYLDSGDDLVALVHYAGEAAGESNFDNWHYRSLVHELARHGLTARIVYLEDIETGPSGAAHAGQRIGLVHRYFLPDPGQPAEMAELGRIAAPARAGAVTVITGLWGEVLSTKASLALLSDEAFTAGLPPALAADLRDAVPWTRPLRERHAVLPSGERVDLVPWTVRNQARLVLKPTLGNKGRDVVIGRDLEPGPWASRVNSALTGQEPWVVQELVLPEQDAVLLRPGDGPPAECAGPSVYGAFVLDGEFVGAIRRCGVRAGAGLMINGLTGAIPMPVYWGDHE
jgi:hypothetical protein